ncbi:hypothetical protein IMSHALPRED_006925 [Imshaugia aleurites]|uniref:Uncharacterized protein n=1 Tax=Imshaugia aleurites TaxID=172621 RepID=A0A8H3ISU1_9LECA|nr:hypothetical protein IMSHALPRED_006925 [Imshaugia aleurites]
MSTMITVVSVPVTAPAIKSELISLRKNRSGQQCQSHFTNTTAITVILDGSIQNVDLQGQSHHWLINLLPDALSTVKQYQFNTPRNIPSSFNTQLFNPSRPCLVCHSRPCLIFSSAAATLLELTKQHQSIVKGLGTSEPFINEEPSISGLEPAATHSQHQTLVAKSTSVDYYANKRGRSQPFSSLIQGGRSRSYSPNRGRGISATAWRPLFVEKGPAVIKDTDPRETKLLWEEVSMALEMAREKLKVFEKRGQPAKSDSFVSKDETPSNSETVPASSSTTKKITPKDGDKFRTRILRPRGISIKREDAVRVEAHFEVDKPTEAPSKWYVTEKKAAPSPLWLDFEDDTVVQIKEIYASYLNEHLLEAEYAAYSMEKFFKMDPEAITTKNREWRSRRMIGIVVKSQDLAYWSSPPEVERIDATSDPEIYSYDFDIRPDCSYWISTKGFNQETIQTVLERCFVWKEAMTGLYLTIEFKKDSLTLDIAENQVAAAGSRGLYNRFSLKVRCMTKAGVILQHTDFKHIRHYGVTMTGANFRIWCIQPLFTEDFKWNGCDMISLSSGNCAARESDIRLLMDWINEIHCWGLTVFAPEYEADIKLAALSRSSGPRISDIVAKDGSAPILRQKSAEEPRLVDFEPEDEHIQLNGTVLVGTAQTVKGRKNGKKQGKKPKGKPKKPSTVFDAVPKKSTCAEESMQHEKSARPPIRHSIRLAETRPEPSGNAGWGV